MQQREQLILQKLAEAHEAQARAMTRFVQARARVMEIETRLQALHSRLTILQTLSVQSPETSLPSTDMTNLLDTDTADDISTSKTTMLPTDIIVAPAEASGDEEETKKLRALHLAQPSQSADQGSAEEGTWRAAMPALTMTSPGIDAPTDLRQVTEEVPQIQDTSATDITTKIPAIRRENDEPQEFC